MGVSVRDGLTVVLERMSDEEEVGRYVRAENERVRDEIEIEGEDFWSCGRIGCVSSRDAEVVWTRRMVEKALQVRLLVLVFFLFECFVMLVR